MRLNTDIAAILIAILGVIVAVIIPEARAYFGLEGHTIASRTIKLRRLAASVLIALTVAVVLLAGHHVGDGQNPQRPVEAPESSNPDVTDRQRTITKRQSPSAIQQVTAPPNGETITTVTTPQINPYAELVHLTASSSRQIAVAISPDPQNWVGLDKLKAELRNADPRVQPDAFDSTKMNADELFANLYDGQTAPLEQSGALTHFQYVVLMRVEERCRPIVVSGIQMISCDLRMQAKAFDNSGQTVANASVEAVGPGFSEDEALDVATKRLASEAKASILAPLQDKR